MFCSNRFSRLALLLSCFTAALPIAAQTEAATATTLAPDLAYFQDVVIVGSNNQISITRLPVTANGKTYYWNLTLPFEVETNGEVTVGLMDRVASPNLIVSAFKPGTYVGPSTILGGQAKIVVAGPGVWNGLYSEWTISAASGANGCTYPATGVFYDVSAITANPLYSRLKAAGITSNAWSYGIETGTCYYTWGGNGLIGVSQVGNTLTIASFTLPTERITILRSIRSLTR